MGLFDSLKKKKEPAAPKTLPADHGLHKEDFKVVGIVYHLPAIARLQEANPDWKMARAKVAASELVNKPIFHYSYVNKPVDLRIDQSNEHGVDRVMVFVAGQHVGYLPEDDGHAAEILRFGSIKYITAKISGGEYRIVSADGSEIKNSTQPSVSVRIAYSV